METAIKYTRRNELPEAVKIFRVCLVNAEVALTAARLKEGQINIALRLLARSIESSLATRGKQHATLCSNKSEQTRLARSIRIQDGLVKYLEGKESLQISDIENSKRRISHLVVQVSRYEDHVSLAKITLLLKQREVTECRSQFSASEIQVSRCLATIASSESHLSAFQRELFTRTEQRRRTRNGFFDLLGSALFGSQTPGERARILYDAAYEKFTTAKATLHSAQVALERCRNEVH